MNGRRTGDHRTIQNDGPNTFARGIIHHTISGPSRPKHARPPASLRALVGHAHRQPPEHECRVETCRYDPIVLGVRIPKPMRLQDTESVIQLGLPANPVETVAALNRQGLDQCSCGDLRAAVSPRVVDERRCVPATKVCSSPRL